MPLCLLLALAAWRWGGRVERQTSFAYLAAAIVVKLTQGTGAALYSSLEWSNAAVDVLLLLTFLHASLRGPHRWLLVATALQLLCSLSHLARMIDGDMSRLAYAILTGTGGYPILISLAAGIVARKRRAARMPALGGQN